MKKQNKLEKINNCRIGFDDIKIFLNKDLALVNFPRCVIIKDTILEDEDISWRGKIAIDSNSNKKICLFETNWIDTMHVNRITFLSPFFIEEVHIGNVGYKFKDIRKLINENKLNNAPDGYLVFYNKFFNNVSYQMDVSFDSPLTLGIKSLDEVPDTLLIKTIVISGEK